MTPAEYRRMTKAQLSGRRVRTLRTMETRSIVIPAGTTAVIVDKFDGLTLRGDACGCCGVSVNISRVPATSVELLPTRPANED